MGLLKDCYRLGYVYDKVTGKGNVKYVKTDYELYCKVIVSAKTFGVQVDRKSKTFRIPFDLKSFMTYRNETSRVDVTQNVLEKVNTAQGFYDDSIDEKLGGKKELLGW